MDQFRNVAGSVRPASAAKNTAIQWMAVIDNRRSPPIGLPFCRERSETKTISSNCFPSILLHRGAPPPGTPSKFTNWSFGCENAGWADDHRILGVRRMWIIIQLVLDLEIGRRAGENEIGHRRNMKALRCQTMM
jgi:hypothetical protein